MSPDLSPWLQRQLDQLRQQRGHALLLAGPPGLGQYPLALSLAYSWLCDRPTPQGACHACESCHAIDVRTHPDLMVLMPETMALEWGWPLDEKTQDKIDKKEIKPSKYIRVDAAREVVAFSQLTRSRGHTKVVLIYPADRLNTESANALLKTLEEPPGHVRFIVATDAVHALLPTIRSRCLSHAMQWPSHSEATAWLQTQAEATQTPCSVEDMQTWLQAAGGRPDQAWQWLHQGTPARLWRQLPRALSQGDFALMADWSVSQQMDALQKLCHDLLSLKAGAAPRFFAPADLPPPPPWAALLRWSQWLRQTSQTMEHPFQAALQQEAWASHTRQALALH